MMVSYGSIYIKFTFISVCAKEQLTSLQLACVVEGGDSLPSSCHPTSSAKSRHPQKKNVIIAKVLNPRLLYVCGIMSALHKFIMSVQQP